MATRTREDLETEVITRAMKDAAFRRQCIADPKGVLEREFGIPLPARMEVHVLEETPTSLYLVLPPAGLESAEDLSDEDLELIAGGLQTGSGQPNCSGICT